MNWNKQKNHAFTSLNLKWYKAAERNPGHAGENSCSCINLFLFDFELHCGGLHENKGLKIHLDIYMHSK